jgi:sugar-phosphatase
LALHTYLYHHNVSFKLSCAALLFDMDGTIVDSRASVEGAWADWARLHNLDLAEVLRYSHGRPTLATMQHFGSLLDPEHDWHAESDAMQARELNESAGTISVPGAADILKALDGRAWAVVTSAPRALAEARIKAAGLPLPPILVPADEITKGKPDPEGFLKAASGLNVAPQDCIVFEDTPPGVEAGLRAGMKVVGLLTTVAVGRLPTPYLIRDFHDLRLFLDSSHLLIESPAGQ